MRRSTAVAAFMLALCAGMVGCAKPPQQQPGPSPRAATPAPAVTHRPARVSVRTPPGMPPLLDARNVYSESRRNHLSRSVAHDLARIYVPNLGGGVSVIDPAAYRVVATLPAGRSPQHVVPAWNLRTLWVTNTAEGRPDGTLTAIDPRTAKPVASYPVDDPYNMYFTPDGTSAIVVAERYARLDFRNPRTMALQGVLHVPGCVGINHADYSADGRYALFTCEFNGRIAKVDTLHRRVLGYLKLSRGMMPQDLRAGPNGRIFYVADMRADGVFVVDGDRFKEIGFIATGVGAHGLYPSRDARRLYVADRGTHNIHGTRRSRFGDVAVIDFATRKIVARWPIPGGGSPDMGNVSADGRTLWLSGRFDNVVYAIDTTSGKVRTIPVGVQPHGLAVWPQPGRYSLGHTGIMR